MVRRISRRGGVSPVWHEPKAAVRPTAAAATASAVKGRHGARGGRASFDCESVRRIIPISQVMSGTANSTVASKLPIQVLFEATRSFIQNLLTGRTVLGQRHWSWGVTKEDRCSASD